MPEYPRPKTPPYGWPTELAIESVRQDLREHAAATNTAIADVRDEFKGLNSHVGNLRLEVAQVSAVCERIEGRLEKDARAEEITKVDTRRYKNKLSLKVWGALLTLLAGGGGAVLHWLLR